MSIAWSDIPPNIVTLQSEPRPDCRTHIPDIKRKIIVGILSIY